MRFALLFAVAVMSTGLHAEIPTAPRHSPEFVLNFTDGTQKLLSGYRGKVVALEFLYTTCPHCQHAATVFTKLYQEYGDKGFQPLGVAFNDNARMLIPDFMRNFRVGYPLAQGDRDTVLTYLGISNMERFNVPQIVWIDRKGTIRSQTLPVSSDEKMYKEDYWREMIETLTKEPVVTTKKPAKATHQAAARK